jgi:hypothetical protein
MTSSWTWLTYQLSLRAGNFGQEREEDDGIERVRGDSGVHGHVVHLVGQWGPDTPATVSSTRIRGRKRQAESRNWSEADRSRLLSGIDENKISSRFR